MAGHAAPSSDRPLAREAMAFLVAAIAVALFLFLGGLQKEASLAITVEPLGAKVRLLEPEPLTDGETEVVAQGGAVRFAALPAGRFARVLVAAPGFKQRIEGVTLVEGNNSLKVALAAESPLVSVVTEPAGAQVYVDNRARGLAPLVLDDLTLGTHVVSARLAGYSPAAREILVRVGQEQKIELTLVAVAADAPPPEDEKAPEEDRPIPPGYGRLIVTSTHHATILVENQIVAMGTKVIRDVLAGPHLVGCKAEGRGMQARRVEIVEETTERVDCAFEDDPLENALRATDPKEPLYWVNLGGTTRNTGRYGEAVEHFKRALELDPSYYEAHRQLGFTLPALKRFDEAKDHLEQYIEANPHAPDLDFAREMIDVYQKKIDEDE